MPKRFACLPRLQVGSRSLAATELIFALHEPAAAAFAAIDAYALSEDILQTGHLLAGDDYKWRAGGGRGHVAQHEKAPRTQVVTGVFIR